LTRGPRLAAAFAVLLVLVPACGVRGLNFEEDDRLTIVSPEDRAEVQLPLTVRWTVRDFKITGLDGSQRPDAGYFGVFVDRAPQPPDQTLEWLARDDEECQSDPTCPNEDYLSQLDIHSTTDTSFAIDRLPEPDTEAVRRREFHDVTIVLLNGRGERIGESAFIRQFEVDRGED
jgi:hypothetical protein